MRAVAHVVELDRVRPRSPSARMDAVVLRSGRAEDVPLTKTAAAKLLIKPGSTVWLSDPARLDLIGELPTGVTVVDRLDSAAIGVIVADDAVSLQRLLATHGAVLGAPTVLWVAYRKGNRADINRDTLWPMVAAYGLRPITQVAIDDVWSGLRFRPLRDDEPPFAGGR